MGEIQYYGGFADVSDGEYQGHTVAIKHLKTSKGGSDRVFKVFSITVTGRHCSVSSQRLCREIIAWKHISHPNILPLIGFSIPANSHCFRILTEWMPNGNIMQYARCHPAANCLQLGEQRSYFLAIFACLSGILSFLKSCPDWVIFMTSGLFM